MHECKNERLREWSVGRLEYWSGGGWKKGKLESRKLLAVKIERENARLTPIGCQEIGEAWRYGVMNQGD